jgi:UDP-N-acetylmuramyl pentapeptide phosphotransferase/UDP-N-acetylglucosamine-1-phosphate transferase
LGKQNRAILDFNLGPQKVHIGKIPRIGGVAVAVALITMGVFFLIEKRPNYDLIWKIILCSLPFFIIGLIEDVTKRIKANYRLLFMMLAAILPFYLINARLIRSSIDIVTKHFLLAYFAFLTVIAIAGFANAINIIDGLNGLSGVISILFLGYRLYILQGGRLGFVFYL